MSVILGAVASAVVPIIADKIFGDDDKTQTTTTRTDYKQVRDDALAAGFNPLTALRAGGAASTTTTTLPSMSSGDFIAQAIGAASNAYFSQRQKQIEMENWQEEMARPTAPVPGAGYARFGTPTHAPALTASPAIPRSVPSRGAVMSPTRFDDRVINPSSPLGGWVLGQTAGNWQNPASRSWFGVKVPANMGALNEEGLGSPLDMPANVEGYLRFAGKQLRAKWRESWDGDYVFQHPETLEWFAMKRPGNSVPARATKWGKQTATKLFSGPVMTETKSDYMIAP